MRKSANGAPEPGTSVDELAAAGDRDVVLARDLDALRPTPRMLEVIALKPTNIAPILEAVDKVLRPASRSARLERQGADLAVRFERLLQSRISRHERNRVLESLRAFRIRLGSREPLDA